MYCPKCGDENEEGAMFCGNCGNPLRVSGTPETRQPIEGHQRTDMGFVRPAGLKILSALMATYGLIFAVGCLWELIYSYEHGWLVLPQFVSVGIAFILGVVSLTTARDLRKLQKYARTVAPVIPLIMVFVGWLPSLGGFGAPTEDLVLFSLPSIILGVGIFLYLRKPKIKLLFH